MQTHTNVVFTGDYTYFCQSLTDPFPGLNNLPPGKLFIVNLDNRKMQVRASMVFNGLGKEPEVSFLEPGSLGSLIIKDLNCRINRCNTRYTGMSLRQLKNILLYMEK